MMDFKILFECWEAFCNKGIILKDVKPHVAESWLRCRQYGLNPLGEGSAKALTPQELAECHRKNKDLANIASPVILNLYSQMPFPIDCIWFTDKNCTILDLRGDTQNLNSYAQGNVCPGAYWGEDIAGTNAVHLAIQNDCVIQTIGAEHFFRTHHDSCCTAVPIHSIDDSILGCLCISIQVEYLKDETILEVLKRIVSIGAYSIECQIELAHMTEINQQVLQSMTEGVLITDRNFNIIKINDSGQKILHIKEDNVLVKNLEEILPRVSEWKSLLARPDRSYSGELAFHLGDRVKRCHGTVNALMFRGTSVGAVLTFTGEKHFNKSVNKAMGNKSYYQFDQIITQNNNMLATISDAKRIAHTSCNVLILGDSGTGKEMLAQSIHSSSPRAQEPLVIVNCAALPRDLVESELFGYEKGAFTGAAAEGRPGKFELANGGTLFLDEIGELPLEIQPKLLRAIETRKVSRIGGKYEKPVDIRLICATNRNLSREVAQNTFRADLYYRINVITLWIPPLIKRTEDIPLLVNYFLDKLNQENNTERTLDPACLDMLMKKSWNGNVRELENVITQSFYLCSEPCGVISGLPKYLQEEKSDEALAEVLPMEDRERQIIVNALLQSHGNVEKAAAALNLGRATIYRKMKKYSISKKEYNKGQDDGSL